MYLENLRREIFTILLCSVHYTVGIKRLLTIMKPLLIIKHLNDTYLMGEVSFYDKKVSFPCDYIAL